MIIPVWKPVGHSTHQIAKFIGQLTSQVTESPEDTKATHTGTLDPLAEGVIIVLTGEDRFKKQEYSDTKKTYAFEILIGISTDSHDLLGLPTELIHQAVDLDQIQDKIANILPDFIGKQKQIQPQFSAQRVGGKSAFELAKSNTEFVQNTNNITIYTLSLIESKVISLKKLESILKTNITAVDGDFRQKEILKKWHEELEKLKKITSALGVLSFETTVSKRTYIRAITRDISQKIHVPATTLSITRTLNGEFSQENCISLDSVECEIQHHISKILETH